MYFVEVAVREPSYHGQLPLTYSSEQSLEPGYIVQVPLRKKQVLGIVVGAVGKPKFALKGISQRLQIAPLPQELVYLLKWIREYYASTIGATASLFLPTRIVEAEAPERFKSPLPLNNLPKLTKDQLLAMGSITDKGMYLLHGDTGSGKTRVYIELAYKNISAGKSVLILTPEIGLTSQLAQGFIEVFGDRVFIIHSQLKETTRQKLWAKLLALTPETPVVVIGPRSALFCPLRKLGLIVIDEEHETAYKQEQAPYYHAVRVASKLAELHKATIVLGSATPSIGDYYLAEQKSRPIIRMTQTAASIASQKSEVSIVDLKDRASFTRKSYLSDLLLNCIQETLGRGEQTLLFLNRRGTARVVLCGVCGWQALCPRCDLPLVYHGDIHTMRCHTCSYNAKLPNSCPQCHNTEIVLKSVGTKAITDEVGLAFPEARLMRFDADNKKSERIEDHYATIHQGEVDIIVGTQILAKGLDLPKLGLVGVVVADTGLYLPDFSAGERTYQLLSQVLGRIGRGHRESKAIIQTYSPSNPVLQAVLKNDWEGFYRKELHERSDFMFPPFCHLLKLACKRATSRAAQSAAERLIKELSEQKLGIAIEGPAPCFHERANNKFNWQIIIKAKRRTELIKVIEHLPSGWVYDIDPINLL